MNKKLSIIFITLTFVLLTTVTSLGASLSISDTDSVGCGTVRLSGRAYYNDYWPYDYWVFTSASVHVSLDLDDSGIYIAASINDTVTDYYIFNSGYSINAYS